MDEEMFLMNELRTWFLDMESTPGDDSVKIVEMTTKDLKFCIKFIDRAGAGLERTDFNFERSSTVAEMLLNSI